LDQGVSSASSRPTPTILHQLSERTLPPSK
jgi:hypothetical protein